MYENRFQKISYGFFLLLLMLIDQLSKYLIRVNGGFYICNRNLAFGLSFPVILIIAAVIIFLLVIYYYKSSLKNWAKLNSVPILLIVSGAASNIIDRINYGCVVDFIDLRFWPVFNLADVFITAGAIILTVNIIKHKN